MAITRLGPGTVTIGTVPMDFSAEVKSAKVTHSYDETSEAVTYLDGSTTPAGLSRADGFGFECDNDLTAAGIYAYINSNDLTEQSLVYTPNTAAGAKWEGTVQVKLPDEIGADEFGVPIASTVEWAAVGNFTFTPATATP